MLLDLSDILQVSPTFTPTVLKMPKKVVWASEVFTRASDCCHRNAEFDYSDDVALETSTLLFCMNKIPDGLQLLIVAS